MEEVGWKALIIMCREPDIKLEIGLLGCFSKTCREEVLFYSHHLILIYIWDRELTQEANMTELKTKVNLIMLFPRVHLHNFIYVNGCCVFALTSCWCLACLSIGPFLMLLL